MPICWQSMDSPSPAESPRLRVILLADAAVYSRLGASLRYLLLGLLTEQCSPLLAGPPLPRGESVDPVERIDFRPLRWPLDRLAVGALSETVTQRSEPDRRAPIIVHALSAALAPAAARLAERLAAPLVLTVDQLDEARTLHLHGVARHVAALVAPSEPIREALSRAAPAAVPVELIRYGLHAADAPAAFRQAGRDPAILASGMSDAGAVELLEAFARLLHRHPATLLFLMGLGPVEPSLRARAAALGVERSVVFGADAALLSVALEGADLLALPRAAEGLSAAPRVALAAGLTIVAAPPVAEDCLIHDQTAWLFDPADPAALGRALEHALDRADQARELAARGQAYVRSHHAVSRMVERTVELYRACLLRAETLRLPTGR